MPGRVPDPVVRCSRGRRAAHLGPRPTTHAPVAPAEDLGHRAREPPADARPVQPDQERARRHRREPTRILLMTSRLPAVRATAEAHAVLRGLARTVGSLVIVQAAGCCDGSAPTVLPAADLPLGSSRGGRRDRRGAGLPPRSERSRARRLGARRHRARCRREFRLRRLDQESTARDCVCGAEEGQYRSDHRHLTRGSRTSSIRYSMLLRPQACGALATEPSSGGLRQRPRSSGVAGAGPDLGRAVGAPWAHRGRTVSAPCGAGRWSRCRGRRSSA